MSEVAAAETEAAVHDPEMPPLVHEIDAKVGPLEKTLGEQTALEKAGHHFKLDKGDMAALWKKALAESYKSLGKNYTKQREFRKEWVLDSYKVVREERMRTTEATAMDVTAGEYLPFKVIVQREGGDEDAIDTTSITTTRTETTTTTTTTTKTDT